MKILDPQYGNSFVGREEEIKELKEKIENNGIVVIIGDRGIGKTNLTLVVEEAINEKKAGFLKKRICYHANGSFFYNEMSKIFAPSKRITGVSSSVSTPVGGAGGGISWNPRESFILEYMEKSKEKILFVENAHELKKVEFETIFEATRRNNRLRFILEIATPYKCDVQLRGGSYEVVKLKELSNEDIEKIVIRECPNFSDVIVKRIISLSKGYPYIARSLAYICDKKSTEEETLVFFETLRDDDMKYNLDRIHWEVLATLNEKSQEVIKTLAIAPTTMTLNLIAAFCGDEVDTPLTDLIERGIFLESKGEVYQIYHPLFREYLRAIQPIALKNKNELYAKAMERVKTAFDSIFILFEVLNGPNIFESLLKQADNNEVIHFVGWQMYTWGDLTQALCAWTRLLERTTGMDKEWESIATGNMGVVYATKGELDKALGYFEEALKLDEELGRKEGMAANFGNIGIVNRIKGELDKALEYHEKALKLDEELGRKEGMAAVYGNIGIVYRRKGEFDKALEYYKKALKLDEELGSKEGIAADYGNIGNVYVDKGELDKALEYFEKALKLNKELERKEGITNQLVSMGVVYEGKGELDKALEHFENALELDVEMDRKEGMATEYGNIGIVYRRKGEFDKALEYQKKSLKLNEELGSKGRMAADYGNIGNVYVNRGELDKALEYFKKALELNKELERRIGIANLLGNMGTVYAIKRELDKALEYFEKALELDEEMGRKKERAAHLTNIGYIHSEKGEFDKALEFYKKTLKIFRETRSRIEIAQTLTIIGDVFVLKADKERALDYYLEAQELAIGSSAFDNASKRINMLLGAD